MKKSPDEAANLPADAIARVAADVRQANLTYLSNEKILSLYECIRRVKEYPAEGDFAEFGIALGGSAICIAREMDAGRSFYGFDVFGMIPPPTQADGDGPARRHDEIKTGRSPGIGGDIYYGYVDQLYDVVKTNFERFGVVVDDQRVHLVRGFFADSLPKARLGKIALAHIDCDWYEPVSLCLRYCAERLAAGGMIILDDYNDWAGCRRATDEFRKTQADLTMIKSIPHAVFVKRES